MESTILQTVVQGGAVALCALLIGLLYFITRNYRSIIGDLNKLLGNHLDHLNDTLSRLNDSMNKNNEVNERLLNRLMK